MKDSVEADELKIGRSLYFPQIAAITVAERQDGAAGAEHLLPEVREGMGGSAQVDLDGFGPGLRLGLRGGGCEGQAEHGNPEQRIAWSGREDRQKTAGGNKPPGDGGRPTPARIPCFGHQIEPRNIPYLF